MDMVIQHHGVVEAVLCDLKQMTVLSLTTSIKKERSRTKLKNKQCVK